MNLPGRVRHERLGCGSVIEERMTAAGNAAVLVKFDLGDEIRLVLASFLKKSPAPDIPAERHHRKPPVSEPEE